MSGGKKDPENPSKAPAAPDRSEDARTVVEPSPDLTEDTPTLPGIPLEALDPESSNVTQRIRPLSVEADDDAPPERYDPEADTIPPGAAIEGLEPPDATE